MKIGLPLKLFTASALCLVMTACAAAPGYTPNEQDIVDSLTPSKYQPASRDIRESIETQDLFAQAAFWSREYELNPADLEAAVKLAAAVRKMGNPGRAVEITQTTRALYPRDPYLIAEYAAALIAAERGQEALDPLDGALKTTPNYARLWSLKGAALDQIERYDIARQHYARALQLTPNDPNIMANMGLNFALAGDPATAEGWLRRASSMPGAGENIRRNLDLVLQLQGKQVPNQTAQRQAPQRQMSGYTSQQTQTRMQTPALRTRQSAPQPSYLSRSGQAPIPPGYNGSSPSASPNSQFGYSTQVYTNTGAGPKTASEAARAAAQRQSSKASQPTFHAPASSTASHEDILGRIAKNVQQKQITAVAAQHLMSQGQAQAQAQQTMPPNPYAQSPVQMRTYPPAQHTASQYPAEPQRRGAARRR